MGIGRWLALAATLAMGASAPARSGENIIVILDASGSMNARCDGGISKIEAARRAFRAMVPDLERSGTRPGLVVFGNNAPSSCGDFAMIAEPGSGDPLLLSRYVDAVQAHGPTPLAAALKLAGDYFLGRGIQGGRIVTLSDGGENCGMDPRGTVQRLVESGAVRSIDVIGFGTGGMEERELRALAAAGHGQFEHVGSAQNLAAALRGFTGGGYVPAGSSSLTTDGGYTAVRRPPAAPAPAPSPFIPPAPPHEAGIDASAFPTSLHFGEKPKPPVPKPPAPKAPPPELDEPKGAAGFLP